MISLLLGIIVLSGLFGFVWLSGVIVSLIRHKPFKGIKNFWEIMSDGAAILILIIILTFCVFIIWGLGEVIQARTL